MALMHTSRTLVTPNQQGALCCALRPPLSPHPVPPSPTGRGVAEVVMLVDAFKHYSKYASQALKVAMPKGGKGGMMRADNARNMQQVGTVGYWCWSRDASCCAGLDVAQEK